MFNGKKGNLESFKNIEKLLDKQVFRLSYWKVANEEINYRRFFHLNDLICLRMEDEAVFDRTHTLIFQLIEDGRIKLFLIHMALEARNRNREIFLNGNYTPLAIKGRFKNHTIAFARSHINGWCLTIIPRFLTSVIKEGEYPLGSRVWLDTEVVLPVGFPCLWENIFTAEVLSGRSRSLRVSEILKDFPVAMLMSEESP